MRYLFLPAKLIHIWYSDALFIFLRIWKNLFLLLDEDLGFRLGLLKPFAVGSPVRIILGFAAALILTFFVLIFMFYWFTLPLLAFVMDGILGLISKILFFSGVILIINHVLTHPDKTLWQVKSQEHLWHASRLRPNQVQFPALLRDEKVKELLEYSEINLPDLPLLNMNSLDSIENETWQLGKWLGIRFLSSEHFFTSLLLSQGFKNDNLIHTLDFFKKRQEVWRHVMFWDEDFPKHYLKKKYSDSFVGRMDVMADLLTKLDEGKGVVIIGSDGVGKKTLVSSLNKRVSLGDLSKTLAQPILLVTPDKFQEMIKKDNNIALLPKVKLREATIEETLNILKEEAVKIERKSKTRITIPALKKLIGLSQRNGSLPGSAVKALERLEKDFKGKWVKESDVNNFF